MLKYLYHPEKEPVIVDKSKSLDGWHDCPTDFIKTTDFGVNPNDAEKVQLLGESIANVTAFCNGMLNLRSMKMRQLRAFAKTFCDGAKANSKRALIEKIEAYHGNSSRHH